MKYVPLVLLTLTGAVSAQPRSVEQIVAGELGTCSLQRAGLQAKVEELEARIKQLEAKPNAK